MMTVGLMFYGRHKGSCTLYGEGYRVMTVMGPAFFHYNMEIFLMKVFQFSENVSFEFDVQLLVKRFLLQSNFASNNYWE